MASPRYHLSSADWGLAASRDIAGAFSPLWFEGISSASEYQRLGFALYYVRRYEAALEVFDRYYAWGEQGVDDSVRGFASIWAGHMLDLLGRRAEAVDRYQAAVDLDRNDTISHDQYGLRYVSSQYAAERLKEPFQRIENREG